MAQSQFVSECYTEITNWLYQKPYQVSTDTKLTPSFCPVLHACSIRKGILLVFSLASQPLTKPTWVLLTNPNNGDKSCGKLGFLGKTIWLQEHMYNTGFDCCQNHRELFANLLILFHFTCIGAIKKMLIGGSTVSKLQSVDKNWNVNIRFCCLLYFYYTLFLIVLIALLDIFFYFKTKNSYHKNLCKTYSQQGVVVRQQVIIFYLHHVDLPINKGHCI